MRAVHTIYIAESGCESERDATWMITWTDTRSGYYNTQRCPGSVDSSASMEYCHKCAMYSIWPTAAGYAHRQCLSDGVWSLSIDTSCCRDTIFESVANQVANTCIRGLKLIKSIYNNCL